MRLIAFLFICLPLGCLAQKVANPDSLFTIARELAYKDHYTEALEICKPLCTQYPENPDYRIFTARVLAWKHDYKEAREFLEPLMQKPTAEVLEVLSDIELWSANYETTIDWCNRALELPGVDSAAFLLKKAKAQEQLDKSADALTSINGVLTKDPRNKEGLEIQERLKDKLRKNKISISYLNSSFSHPYFPAWNFGFIEYMRNFKKCPLLARANYGNVNGATAYMFEVDAYPKLRPGTYMYLNTGYSAAPVIFPGAKFGADLYQKVFKQFEVSGGIRYMKFTAETVFIYTGYVGMYYKNWWFAFREYIVAPKNTVDYTHTATIRRYLKAEQTYVSLNLIYGAAPYFYSFIQDIAQVNATRIGVDAQLKIASAYYIKPLLMYEYEEYYPGLRRDRWDVQITLSRKF